MTLDAQSLARARAYNEERPYTPDTWRIIQTCAGTTADGLPGLLTARKVARMQGRLGLTVDGQAGPATLAACMVRWVPELRQRERRALVLDVSKYQHPINAAELAPHVDAVIVKVSEATWEDPYFKTTWRALREAGVRRATYHLARPLEATAEASAQRFLELLGDDVGEQIPWLDLETRRLRAALASHGRAWTGDWIEAWLQRVERTVGKAPGLYWSERGVKVLGSEAARLRERPTWWARYVLDATGRDLSPPWSLWQWTSHGACPGVDGRVDLNVFNGSACEMLQELGL